MVTKITAPVRIDISGGWPDSDPYRADFGGTVLNAAINLYVSAHLDDANLVTSVGNVPRNSGLGTSGALRAAYLAAANPKLLENKTELIKRVHKFENEVIGHRAGWQDEAAAIYGGVNLWDFGANGSVRRNPIPRELAVQLENRLVLVYTGKSHLSSNIHDLVFGPDFYESNIPKLDRMKEIAKETAARLLIPSCLPSDIAELIKETWELQKSLHPSIETDTMKKLQEETRGGYLAARATGAGGGGCIIFYTKIKDALTKDIREMNLPGVRVLPFNFDYEGIKITENS